MPLTEKGEKILRNMTEYYGSPEKAEEVLYASKNAGTISGIDAGALFPAELTPRREELDAGALLSASGSPGRAFGGGARRDHGYGGTHPLGARVGDWSETYTFEQGTDGAGRDDEYATPGTGQTQPQQQQQETAAPTGDQPEMEEEEREEAEPEEERGERFDDQGERINTLPGGLPEGTLEHPQEHPGRSAPPAPFGADNSPMHPAYGQTDAAVGYGGIAGGVFKQDWGDQNPHPFADQLPGGMSPTEIERWGREHYWNQWLPK